MRSRAARLTLLILFIVALGATAYLFWNGESLASDEAAALQAFEDRAREASRAVLDTRAAQQAYVAAGQAGEFWPGKVASGIATARSALAALRQQAASAPARGEVEAALAALDDFAQLDRRVRSYTGSGQNLLASDLIFGDGLEMAGGIDARLQQARALETGARQEAMATFKRRQIFALAAAAAAASLVVLLLLTQPAAQRDPEVPADARVAAPPASSVEVPLASGAVESEDDWSPPKPLSVVPRPEPAPDPQPPPPAAEPTPAIAAHTDFSGVALLCTDLARVIDTEQLPSLLDRASSLLDAKGIILWLADPEGRELNPIVAHGYAPQLVDRLGTIPREAENATAAAFRTSLLQTVEAESGSNGAIAAPLVTPSGCVGVMAAEVRHHGEREHTRLAAAAIMAAQFATLVGPPARTHTRAGAGA